VPPIYQRELPNVVALLQTREVAPDLSLDALYDEPPLLFTAQGFGLCRAWVRDRETGEVSPLELFTLDMMAARDVGIGGHAPASDYAARLFELPADPSQWTARERQICEDILARSRHLFLLAMDAEVTREPAFDCGTDEQTQARIAYFCARTLAEGELQGARGEAVELPGANWPAADQFEELNWPRFYRCERGTIRRDSPRHRGEFLQSGAPLPHIAETLWGGLLRNAQTKEG